FADPVDYGNLLGPDEVRLSDLDGNGTLDAAVATHNTLAILLGDGHGALGTAVEYDPGSNEGTLAVADFDGDGDPDVAITDYELAVYRNNGDATLSGPIHYPAGLYPRDVEAGDLDGDGNADLVVASQDDAIQVLLGVGDGTFLPAVPHAVGTTPNALKIADMNGDAIPDLVVVNFHGESVSVLFGTGGGGFAPQLSIPLGNQALLVEVGDVDGDGARDIVAMCRMAYENSGGIRLLAGDGAGGFGLPVLVPTQYEGQGAVIADLDEDGLTDLLVGHSYLSLFRGNGTTQLGAPRYPTSEPPQDMVCGRFDADTVPDLVVLTDGGPEFLHGVGDGSFDAVVPLGPATVPRRLAHGDFDGNGTLDLAVVEDGPNQAGIWLGDGNGGFTRHAGFGAGQNPWRIAAGHLDDDGILDLAIANQTNLALLFGTGAGTSRPPCSSPGAMRRRLSLRTWIRTAPPTS
ncbi:VCBS repeat-containing protein, partial [bacterium]|nr:VCBS repeat-containing protein [bacterium]